MSAPTSYTAFAASRRIGVGPLAEVACAVKASHDAGTHDLIVFEDATGRVVDLDLRGGLDEVLGRLPKPVAPAAPEPAPRGRGRPRLGVAAREVTLLPRHWDWLASQPGGASAALRRLVEQASRDHAGADTARAAQEAAYRAMYALAGHLPGYEEALRALYAPAPEQFDGLIAPWPADVAAYVRHLAGIAFELAGRR